MLGIAGGENDRTTYGDSSADEQRYENVLVVDQGSVDMTECSICHNLTFGIGFVWLNVPCVVGSAIRKVACDFTLGLWILGGNKFWRGRLLLLDATRYSFLSTSTSGWVLLSSHWCWESGIQGGRSGGPSYVFAGILLCKLQLEDFLGWSCHWCLHGGLGKMLLVGEKLRLQLRDIGTQ